jgi:hypothetical protein
MVQSPVTGLMHLGSDGLRHMGSSGTHYKEVVHTTKNGSKNLCSRAGHPNFVEEEQIELARPDY